MTRQLVLQDIHTQFVSQILIIACPSVRKNSIIGLPITLGSIINPDKGRGNQFMMNCEATNRVNDKCDIIADDCGLQIVNMKLNLWARATIKVEVTAENRYAVRI
jgi:hypothetical protein